MSELHRRCPVCDAESAKPHWQKPGVRLVQCQHCAMVYSDPVSTEFVSGEFYQQIGTPSYLSSAKLESDYAPVRFQREWHLLRAFCRQGAVLDVGSSTGAFLFGLQSGVAAGSSTAPGNYQVTGLDVSGPALDYAANKGIEVIRSPFLEHDFGVRRFEAVTFWAVLEHLAEPRRFLEKTAVLLRPGGHCFVLVPNLNSLAMRWLGPRYRYVMPEHLNYFTLATLRKLAGSVPSLDLVAARFLHFNPVAIWQDLHGSGETVTDQDRARLLRRTTALKQAPWLKPVKMMYAAVERALGASGLADNVAIVLQKR